MLLWRLQKVCGPQGIARSQAANSVLRNSARPITEQQPAGAIQVNILRRLIKSGHSIQFSFVFDTPNAISRSTSMRNTPTPDAAMAMTSKSKTSVQAVQKV